MRWIANLLLLGNLLVVPVAAQAPVSAPPSTRLSLAAAVEAALAHYPAVAVARSAESVAAAEARQARAARLPTARLLANATEYEQPALAQPIHGLTPGAIPPFSRSLLQTGVNVNYLLLDGGGRAARIRAAGSEEQAATAGLADAESTLRAEVVASYLAVLGRARILAAHDRRLAALEQERGRVQQLLAAGQAAEVDRLRAEAALAAAQAERVRFATALDSAERDLGRWIGADVEATRAARLEDVRLAEGETPDRAALVAAGLAASPTVERARQALAAAEAGCAVARSVRRPELRGTAGLTNFAADGASAATEWSAGLALAVPLFDGGLSRAGVARAEAARDRARSELELAELAVGAAVDRTSAALAEAQARVLSLRSAAARYAEVARVEHLLLENGAGTQIDYLAAEADLLGARASLADAEYSEVLGRVELERSIGGLDSAWLERHLRPVENPR